MEGEAGAIDIGGATPIEQPEIVATLDEVLRKISVNGIKQRNFVGAPVVCRENEGPRVSPVVSDRPQNDAVLGREFVKLRRGKPKCTLGGIPFHGREGLVSFAHAGESPYDEKAGPYCR